jgi:hypothetical protein
MVWIRRKLKQYVYCNLQVDPEEECRILAREKAATVTNFENTIRRQSLVLKKRDIMNKKAREEAQKKLVQQLLEAEGLELDDDRF